MSEWRKVLVSGSTAHLQTIEVGGPVGALTGTLINHSTVAGTQMTGSFTGSFTGDGSGLSGTSSPIIVKEEGSNITTAVSSFDFVGGDITATNDGNNVTITAANAAAQTSIQTIYNTSLIIGRAANDTTIDFTTDDKIIFDVGATEGLRLDTTGLTVAGNLTVKGSQSIVSSQNLSVGDAFIFTATGSAASNVDSGLIVQSGSVVDSGSALYHDINDERWSVAKSIAADATAVTSLEHVVTVKLLGDDDAPVDGDSEYGVGEMAINNNGSVWVYT
jgi:hypothetical protein|tara:strand:+ start:510 stop:1334 length:825 start_codon:yes stop_codon:yes gene_type:complete